jgi:two-component system phosphate regulon sensor histidine kinase PhoR
MKINKLSFRLKLTFSFVLIILISFGFVVYYLDKNLEENSLQEIKTSLLKQAYLVESQITKDVFKKEEFDSLDRLIKALSPKIQARLTLINKDGKVLVDSDKPKNEILSMENHAERPEVKIAWTGKVGSEIRHSATLKIDMLYVALPLKEQNEIIGVLRIALPLENVQKTLFTVRKTVLLGFLFALGLALVLGSILATGIIKPINKIISASRRYSEGNFSRPIFVDSQDEIGELAVTLNKMAQDIEDKIRQLNTQNQYLKGIFSSMIEGVILVDNSTRIISINPSVEQIFSVSKSGVEGKLFLETIRNNDISDIINSVFKQGKFISQELSLIWPVHKTFQINASPIFDREKAVGCLVVLHDITEIRKLETVRRDFVANASHELKTPLTSIKGFVETLLEGALEDKENSRQFLNIIQEHTNRLDNLINDLLELSYIESQKMDLRKEEFKLGNLVDEILIGFKSQLNKFGIQVNNNLAPGLIIYADKEKLGRVLVNLIDNAIKFNKEKGSIEISSEDLDKGTKVIIEDSGIGIPEKDIPRIFERFYRVDKARSRQLGGTGLGLSIVKHIVELHGGSVGVESVEGLGSKFHLILPKKHS